MTTRLLHVLSCFFLATLAGSAAAETGKRPLEIDDLYRFQRIASPDVSPDGRWVAYTVTTSDLTTNSTSTDIWISATDGSAARRLTTNPAADHAPSWSPDGTTIAFVSARGGDEQIWLITVDGGEARQLTSLSTGASHPVWSPDGSLLAFVSEVFPQFSDRPFHESDSLNRDFLKTRTTRLVKAEIYTELLYRHWNRWTDGRRAHIFVQPLAGGNPRDLTPGDRDAVPSSSTFSSEVDFSFSPDGREIAYTATPVPSRSAAWSTNHDIYLVPVAGGAPRQLTTNPAADSGPQYSPDGRFLAYRAQERPGSEADRWSILVRERSGGTLRSVTGTLDLSVETFAWSPDGRGFLFTAAEKAQTAVFFIGSDGKSLRRLVTEHANSSVTVSRENGTVVFLQSRAVRPADVYRTDLDGATPFRITSQNDSLLAEIAIPSPESILFPGYGDTPVQGWVYRPARFDSGRKYPLVMLVHGGPQGAWQSGWSYRWNPALWAAQGYVVFAPNPRGSTGFGQAFTDAISRDWGGAVFVDLMRGLDRVQRFSYVDTARIGAAGASYGGYMINWMLGNAGNRFKAMVTHCGVYNFESIYGTTDELWFDEWERGGTPWDNPEGYRRFSPNLYAANFRTPTLVVHGANDLRVPYSEAMQLFTALQRQGVPSKFLFFPDEGHWVLKPANSRFWHQTVFEWLGAYLKPGS